jgi:hemerythrin-like domain-containing protein
MAMDAIETLMGEHRVIERVLDALVGFAAEVQRTGSSEKEELGRFVTFVREFADAFHHGKEEDVLFAAMVEHGFPREGGPVAVMLHEHDQGRELVRILRARAEQPAAWSDADRMEVAAVAQGFAGLLRAHIHKEDAILYPMADQRLPPEAMEAVSVACETYEQDEGRAGKRAALQALAEDLVRRHAAAVHPAESPAPGGAGCCG